MIYRDTSRYMLFGATNDLISELWDNALAKEAYDKAKFASLLWSAPKISKNGDVIHIRSRY